MFAFFFLNKAEIIIIEPFEACSVLTIVRKKRQNSVMYQHFVLNATAWALVEI